MACYKIIIILLIGTFTDYHFKCNFKIKTLNNKFPKNGDYELKTNKTKQNLD